MNKFTVSKFVIDLLFSAFIVFIFELFMFSFRWLIAFHKLVWIFLFLSMDCLDNTIWLKYRFPWFRLLMFTTFIYVFFLSCMVFNIGRQLQVFLPHASSDVYVHQFLKHSCRLPGDLLPISLFSIPTFKI